MNLFLKSLGLVNKNKKNVLLIIFIEFIFIFLLYLSGIFVYNQLLINYENIQNLGNELILAGETEEEIRQIESSLLALDNVLNKLIYAIVGYGLFVVIWSSLFLGLSNLFCLRFFENKKITIEYFLKFFVLSLLWFIVLVGLISLTNFLFTSVVLFWLFLLALFYFVSISFCGFLLKDKLKEGIKAVYLIGIKKFIKVFPIYIIGMFAILGAGALFTYLSKFFVFFSLFGIFVFLLIFVWFRIFLIMICGRQDSNL